MNRFSIILVLMAFGSPMLANTIVLRAQNIGGGQKQIDVNRTFYGLTPGNTYTIEFDVLSVNKPVTITGVSISLVVNTLGSHSITFVSTANDLTLNFFHQSSGVPAKIELDNMILVESTKVTEEFCTSVNNPNYRYAFNGYEKDDEVQGKGNFSDFGARCYNPRLGRFLTIDPKVHEYCEWAPYLFAGNNPLGFRDENGEGPDDPNGGEGDKNKAIQPAEAKNHSGRLSFTFVGLDRKQISGDIGLKLNTDFSYIQPFAPNADKFKPDEPSSFSSLEYTYKSIGLGENGMFGLDLSAGAYRNHTKGGFTDDSGTEIIHFGKGNSNVGVSSSLELRTPSIFGFDASIGGQIGTGPQFTELRGEQDVDNQGGKDLTITPGNWGVRGWGVTTNVSFNLNTPVSNVSITGKPGLSNVLSGWSASVTGMMSIHSARYSPFQTDNAVTGETIQYDSMNTVTGTQTPLTWTFKLSYNFKHK